MNVTSGKKLAESLENSVLNSNPYFNTMLRILATRCMLQAVYFCSGTVEKKDFHHYGLAAPIYTHFTSPIRRFFIKIDFKLFINFLYLDIQISLYIDYWLFLFKLITLIQNSWTKRKHKIYVIT